MKTKKIFSIFLSILLALVVVACSANQNATNDNTGNQQTQTKREKKENPTIAWIHMNAAAQSEQRAKKGFEDYIKSKKYNWEITTVDSKGSGQTLASNLEDAVQRGVDAIIVSMADLRAAKASLTNAKKAGIPVFAIDSGWTEGIIVDITSNNYVMSSKVSSYLVDQLGGKGNIIAFKMAEHHGVRKRGDVLDLIVKENPGIKILESHNIDYSNFYQDTQKTMEDYLSRYGDKIDAVWAGWDEPAMAAAEAIKQAGYTRDQIKVVGIDGHPPAVDEMRNNKSPLVATVAQGFEIMGEKVADYIYDIVTQGKDPKDVIPSTTIYVDTPLITEKNLPNKNTPPYKATDFYSSK